MNNAISRSVKILLSSSLFAAVFGQCKRNEPRKEGFLQKPCTPGYYEGSCLIILERQTFHQALDKCRNEYGGRLATAPTKDAIQHWIRSIYFYPKFDSSQQNTLFWIGYDKNGFKNEKPEGKMKSFIDTTMWTRVFNATKYKFVSTLEWENSQNFNNLQDSDCPTYGTVFNSKSKKFDVRKHDEHHYALCETPRWAKLQCSAGWHLVSPIRMCLKVHENFTTFVEAHDICRDEGSFVSVAREDELELEMFREVIIPYNLSNVAVKDKKGKVHGGFWNGLRKPPNGMEMFTLDGTTTTVSADPEIIKPSDNYCDAITYTNWFYDNPDNKGILKECDAILPYMCQRFADQSTTNNIY